jgi:hypothetical protein
VQASKGDKGQLPNASSTRKKFHRTKIVDNKELEKIIHL